MQTPDDFEWFVSNYVTDWPDRLDVAKDVLLQGGFIDTSTVHHDLNLAFAGRALISLGLARNTTVPVQGQGATIVVHGIGVLDEGRLRRFDPRVGTPQEVRVAAADQSPRS